MTSIPFQTGSSVLTADGAIFGTIERVSESDVFVQHEGREVRIPKSMFEAGRSTGDRLVLSARFESPENGTGTTLLRHAEELTVNVKEVDQGRVRFHKSVEQIPVQEDVELGMDMVDVERVPSGEEFDEMPQNWQDGDTLVIPVVEEVLVLTRRYRVTENVRVTRRREVRTERIETELRRESVSFSEEDADGNPVEP